MKNCCILIAALIFALATNAQSLSPSVIAPTGGFSSNANNSLSYTVGEMTMVQTFSASNNILTQGFQQSNDLATGLLNVAPDAAGDLELYPNPAVDKVSYAFEFNTIGTVSFVLTNIWGQKVAEIAHLDYDGGRVSQMAQVSTLASGTYFLTATLMDQSNGATSSLTRKFQVIR